MAVRIGTGILLSTPVTDKGTDAEGTILAAQDLDRVIGVQTDGTNVPKNSTIDIGDSITLDANDDGLFNEIALTHTDGERYVASTITLEDGTVIRGAVELVDLSDGSQLILMRDNVTSEINTADSDILSIELGNYNATTDDLWNQNLYANTLSVDIVCFTRGTRITTPSGDVPVEDLKVGMSVTTLDRGGQPIAWIGSRRLTRAELEANPKLFPVKIEQNALGPHVPEQDLYVSPQHRISTCSRVAERMFGEREVLIPATKLTNLAGIDRDTSQQSVEYFHILFDRHEIVLSNGAPSESLFTGPQALASLSPEAREEIETLFPDLCHEDYVPTSVREIVQKNAVIDNLVRRVTKNQKPLVER